MGRGRHAGRRQVRARALTAFAGAATLALVAGACALLPLGSAGNRLGNDVSSCPNLQPSQAPPCGPQPMVWASIAGPYAPFVLGDPYATKCGQDLPATPADCTAGPYVGGATNVLYNPSGYSYAIDVHPEDVGHPLQLQVWDAGSYPRSAGGLTTKDVVVSRTNGSATLNRTSGPSFRASDVGHHIAGTGIPAGTTVLSFQTSNRITLSSSATSTGTNRTVTIADVQPDCPSSQPPFNAAPYPSVAWDARNCQTGDTGSSPFQLEVVPTDGSEVALPGCSLYVAAGSGDVTYENAWVTACSFTPPAATTYVARVKSSGIVVGGTPVPDQGDGANSYALRLTGGTTSRLFGIGALSIHANTPASVSRFYLTELPSTAAGRRLQLDVFDPGDGSAGDYFLQILGAPAGAPNLVPTAGSLVPSAGVADSCRYNPVPSATRGPDVSGPGGADATDCRMQIRAGAVNIYDNAWLRIQIDLSPDYACTTDCWWSVRLDNGGALEAPDDHQVWVPSLVDIPARP